MATYPFVQAAHFRAGGNLPINRIVIHRMEAPEKGNSAETCAQYFHTTDRTASAHYCVDVDSVVQCVHDTDTAYHAPPNQHSLGIEHAGYTADSDWSDAYDQSMLRVSAQLAASLCTAYQVPVVWLTPADLRAGKRGITSHNNVSVAWGQTTHTDPGPNFPVTQYLSLITSFITPVPTPLPLVKEPDMVIIKPPGAAAYLLTSNCLIAISDPPEHDALRSAGVPEMTLTDSQWVAIQKYNHTIT